MKARMKSGKIIIGELAKRFVKKGLAKEVKETKEVVVDPVKESPKQTVKKSVPKKKK